VLSGFSTAFTVYHVTSILLPQNSFSLTREKSRSGNIKEMIPEED
jgi:hypothetical protein